MMHFVLHAARGTEIVRMLLEHGADPTALDNCMIRHACAHGHTEIVRLLLVNPAVNPAIHDNWALQIARQKGHTEIVRLLLERQRDFERTMNFIVC